MTVYKIASDQIKKLDETTFGEQGIKEGDLQQLLLKNINVISPETFVLDEEFSDWRDSKRRIDILALDKNAHLVVIELKRTEDGGYMELQAIRYAAMVSTLTFEKTVEIHDSYLKKHGHDGDAETEILKFLGWEEPDEECFNPKVRIVLASADFSKELTTSVMWLNKQDNDIKCVRMKPYCNDGQTLVDVQQLIPLPEAEDYLIKVREREQQVSSFSDRKKFWEGLLSYAKTRTNLHERISPSGKTYISASAGFPSIGLKYEILKNEARVTLYIEGKSAEDSRNIYQTFSGHKDEIENNFGKSLTWRDEEGNMSCSIFYTILNSGYRSDEDKWPEIFTEMVDAMINLEKTFRPHIDKLEN